MILSSADSFWLRAETPETTSHWVMAFEVLGDELDIETLRARVAERLPSIPWAAWRIDQPRLGLGRYRYVATEPLPLDRLVVREHAPGGFDAYMAAVVMSSFDPSLPMWRLRLVDDTRGRQFIVLDAHHAFVGGYSGVELLLRFLGADVGPSTAAAVTPPRRISRWTRVVDAAWGVAALGYRTLARLRPAARWGPARSGEPLVGPIGRARVVVTEALPAERLAAICDAHGASRTRVVLALVARALDPYVTPGATSLRALFPHGTQVGDVTGPGNAARSTFLELPLGLEPRERLAAVRAAIAKGSEGPEGFAVADLTLSIPRPLEPLAVGGRRVVPYATSAPLRVCSHPLTRLTIVVQGHPDGIYVTFTADRDSLAGEVPGIVERLRAAIDELEHSALVSR